MLSLLLCLRMDFFGFLPTKTLGTSTLSADLELNFLSLYEFSDFLLCIHSSIGSKVTTPLGYLEFSKISVEIKLPVEVYWN